MKKNIQNKIVLIFFIVGILIIAGISAFTVYTLQKMSGTIDVSIPIRDLLIISAIALVLYILITIVIKYFVSKSVVKPINRLIESAEKMAKGQNMEMSNILNEKTEVDELVNAFNLMTRELNQKLTEVNRQKKQIETILLHMTDGVIAFDMNGEIIHINPAAKTLLGLTDKEDTFEKMFKKLNIVVNLEKIIYLENWTSSEQKGEVGNKAVNLFFAPFQDENDKPTGVMVVIQDITEHVKLDNMRREFVADVSHELKTPIALIQGYAEGLLENVTTDDESRKFYAEVILDESNKMDKLVKQLLELMKIEYGKREFTNEKFDLKELIDEVIRKCNVMLKENGITINFRQEEPVYIYADEFYIDQAVTNYFTNAIKHAEEKNGKKEIEIRIEKLKDENKVRLYVYNTGENIAQEDLERIWKRFYKVDTSRNRENGGTGIGLALVKAIMNNYKNEYGVANKEDGVEFYFDLDLG